MLAGHFTKPDGCSICFSSHGVVDKGWDRWQGRHPGGKVHEPISSCQAATVLLLLRNRIYPVSRAEAGDLHEEGGDGGCGGCFVCVCAWSCGCACMCVCMGSVLYRIGLFLKLAWESVFSDGGWVELHYLISASRQKKNEAALTLSCLDELRPSAVRRINKTRFFFVLM